MKNDKGLIMSYLSGKSRYMFDLEGYMIPTEIDGFNLLSDRKTELLTHTSSYVKNFESDIISLCRKNKKVSQDCTYIREFPVPIENVEFYHNLLISFGLCETCDYWKYRHFKLDFMFPYLNLIVEIDSNYHDGKKSYDKVRDLYMKSMYGFEIIRLYEYGKSGKTRPEMFNKFTDYLGIFTRNRRISMQNPVKIGIDFSQSILDIWIKENSGLVRLLEKLKLDLGFSWYTSDTVIIDFDTYNSIWPLDDKIFIMNLENIIKYVYRKNIIIKNSSV